MAKAPAVQLEGQPFWYDGKVINETAFCQDFLTRHKLAFTENAFFTPEGRITDESLLKEQIFFSFFLYPFTSYQLDPSPHLYTLSSF